MRAGPKHVSDCGLAGSGSTRIHPNERFALRVMHGVTPAQRLWCDSSYLVGYYFGTKLFALGHQHQVNKERAASCWHHNATGFSCSNFRQIWMSVAFKLPTHLLPRVRTVSVPAYVTWTTRPYLHIQSNKSWDVQICPKSRTKTDRRTDKLHGRAVTSHPLSGFRRRRQRRPRILFLLWWVGERESKARATGR